MTRTRQLTSKDVLYIGGETSRVYQHTAGLVMLQADRGFGFDAFRRHLETRLAGVAPFHWRLHQVPLGLDLPYWVEDDRFRFDHHVRRIAVPSPGDREALAELVSTLYCRHLDRSRPLWEAWFIEGLPRGQYALVQKLHHCMMDGQAANSLGERTCDRSPDAPPRPAPDPADTPAAGAVPDAWHQWGNVARKLSTLPLRAGREMAGALGRDVGRRFSAREVAAVPPVPRTRFNADIGSQRGFVFGSLPLADIKRVKDRFGSTVNDVLLALVGTSLREYLLRRDELPAHSLRTSIPVSLRTGSDEGIGNQLTTANVTLGTALADPLQRLQAIATESESAKQLARGGGKGIMEMLGLMPPVLVNAMFNLVPAEQTIRMAGSNLVISNVRGSDEPMYMGRARMTAMYPMSIIAPGSGINVTCVSYTGQAHFGITVEPDLVPEPWQILDGLGSALGEYVALERRAARTTRRGTTGKSTGNKGRGASARARRPKRA